MNDRRALLATVVALGAAGVLCGQVPEAGSIEEAKRDLEKIPAAQTPPATPPAPAWPRVGVPALSIETPSATPRGNTSAADASKVEPSDGWLVDGVRQLTEEDRARRTDARQSQDREEAAEASRETTHPFGEYMSQWLSPAERALLTDLNRAGSDGRSNANASPRTPADHDRAWRETDPRAAARPGMSPGAATSRATSPNPYLDEGLGTTTQTPLTANNQAATAEAVSLPSAIPATTLPPVTPPSAMPVASPGADASSSTLPSPTERLIDDRKYFPQLRRF